VGDFLSRAVIGAPAHGHPLHPRLSGPRVVCGSANPSSHYHNAVPLCRSPCARAGRERSGAQIMAELSLVAQATWVTLHDPVFLPDDVDGRVLFERATARVLGGRRPCPLAAAISSWYRARRQERGALHAVRPFVRMTATGVVWPDGRKKPLTRSSGVRLPTRALCICATRRDRAGRADPR
jgi:hypothetical protein